MKYNIEEAFMSRCFALARKGENFVAPNPQVGSVITFQDRIIGEGYHEEFGGSHAEVNAINNVKTEDVKYLKSATIYVSLEPCCHFGKTPPCVDLILEKKIKKVVISVQDPNPLVAGKGVEKLRSLGVEVVSGVLEREGESLILDFVKQVCRASINLVGLSANKKKPKN